jgi:hypothetical protein
MPKNTLKTLTGATRILWILVFMLASVMSAYAGPPFLTDDPIPVDYHHWEFYTFAAGDRTGSSNSVSGPAIEINNGVAPNVQLHLVVPDQFASSPGMSAHGLGDIETGVKYRFVQETKTTPAISTFPLIELPTGNSNQGLGNGRTWFKLPIWLQRDSGSWTSYGGGGYAINSAPGQRSYWFGGLLVQTNLSQKLTLGSEVFLTGAQTSDTRETSICNIGGQYNFTPDFSLLFSYGHSIQGQGNTVYYVSLYRTWGPGAP